MSDFAPPTGPPPPRAPEVPSGWTARWNEQYREWFYVNIYTKKSQWDKPTHPVYPDGEAPPSDPPPGYDGHGRNSPYPSDSKTNPYSNSGHMGGGSSSRSQQEDEDARMAARLQAEENARGRGGSYSGGAADSYRQGQSTSPYPPPGNSPYSPPQQQQQGQSGERGLLSSLAGGFIGSKLANKNSHSQNPSPSGFPGAPGAGPYGGYGPPPPQGYGPPPPQGYGPPPGYGPGAYGGGYGPPPQQYQQYAPSPQPVIIQQQAPPPKKSGGLGTLGGAALGIGGGLVGGLLIEDAIDHFEDKGYEQGYDQGYDNGFDNGYDDGGGDW